MIFFSEGEGMSGEEVLCFRSSLLFYQTEDGKQRIEVRLNEETV